MKVLMTCLLTCLFFGTVDASPHVYEKKYVPHITSINPTTVALSDGSVWKIVNQVPDWKANDEVMIRWNNEIAKYFLSNTTRDPSMVNSKDIAIVEIVSPTEIKITGNENETVLLSDGSRFSIVPFIGTFHVGDRVIFTLNEHPNNQSYPFFIIGFESKGDAWQTTGEVQARLNGSQ